MDITRQLDPISAALASVLDRDDLADWARQHLTNALNSISDVVNTVGEPECQWCGTGLPSTATTPSTGRPRDYCSRACQQAAYRDRTRPEPTSAKPSP